MEGLLELIVSLALVIVVAALMYGLRKAVQYARLEMDGKTFDLMATVVGVLVASAEQVYRDQAGSGREKKTFVTMLAIDFAEALSKKTGIKFDYELIDRLIEEQVFLLKG